MDKTNMPKQYYIHFNKYVVHTIIYINNHYFLNKASPANGKLGLRMTTLHEEPTKSMTEHLEETYSDSDYPEYESFESKQMSKQKNFSRMSSSKTMSALTDMHNHSSSNMHTYTSGGNTALKHIVGTPSMSSSASSGYGSQVHFSADTYLYS